MKGTGTAKRENDKPLFFLTLAAFLSVLLMPDLAGDGMRSGLLLCARAVIPSVFPSIVLTDFLHQFRTDHRLVPSYRPAVPNLCFSLLKVVLLYD